MIIRQTTTIIFEYPQDYLQEQEWCKTKTDEWIHVGTDTRCSIYENKISYSIGQPSSSENPNNSTISKMEQVDKDINVRSKDEPQTEYCGTCRFEDYSSSKEPCNSCLVGGSKWQPKDEPQEYPCEFCRNSNSQKCEECKDFGSNYEPQTDCPWK